MSRSENCVLADSRTGAATTPDGAGAAKVGVSAPSHDPQVCSDARFVPEADIERRLSVVRSE
jgi:hypothetical protein